jgi:hypothetical protein
MRYKSFAALFALWFAAMRIYAASETSQTNKTVPWFEIATRAGEQNHDEVSGISAAGEGALLHCRLQKLDGEATWDGLWLTSTVNSGRERLQVTATAVGRAGPAAVVLPTTGNVRVRDSLVCWERTGVTEEYSVGVDGVRQDFIIGRRLPGKGGLRVELRVAGATAKAMAGGAKLTLDGCRREIAYSRLNVVDAGGKILAACIEVDSPTCLAVRVDDDHADYPVRIDPTFTDANWISLGGLPGVNGSVSALVVSTNTGRVYIGGYSGNLVAGLRLEGEELLE